MAHQRIQELVNLLDLQPHPEGGFYKEIYRSKGMINEEGLPGYSGKRNYATSIYFLLTKDNFSAFHSILQDELWHHYEGDVVEVHCIDQLGKHRVIELGKAIDTNQQPQAVVFGGEIFGSRVKIEGEYALVGCTVAPGFDFEDFELCDRKTLLNQYPQHVGIINALTRM